MRGSLLSLGGNPGVRVLVLVHVGAPGALLMHTPDLMLCKKSKNPKIQIQVVVLTTEGQGYYVIIFREPPGARLHFLTFPNTSGVGIRVRG